MVLLNAETWFSISKKTMNTLHNFFNSFYRCIFRVSSGSPKPNYYWQTGSIRMHNLILKKQLMFYHHLANLPPDSLAREFFEIQVERDLGIATELREHLEHMGNRNPREVSKLAWKKSVGEYIEARNRRQLLDDIRGYKKLSYEELSAEKFERKPYLSNMDLENVRMKFKITSQVVPTIRKNFPGKY